MNARLLAHLAQLASFTACARDGGAGFLPRLREGLLGARDLAPRLRVARGFLFGFGSTALRLDERLVARNALARLFGRAGFGGGSLGMALGELELRRGAQARGFRGTRLERCGFFRGPERTLVVRGALPGKGLGGALDALALALRLDALRLRGGVGRSLLGRRTLGTFAFDGVRVQLLLRERARHLGFRRGRLGSRTAVGLLDRALLGGEPLAGDARGLHAFRFALPRQRFGSPLVGRKALERKGLGLRFVRTLLLEGGAARLRRMLELVVELAHGCAGAGGGGECSW